MGKEPCCVKLTSAPTVRAAEEHKVRDVQPHGVHQLHRRINGQRHMHTRNDGVAGQGSGSRHTQQDKQSRAHWCEAGPIRTRNGEEPIPWPTHLCSSLWGHELSPPLDVLYFKSFHTLMLSCPLAAVGVWAVCGAESQRDGATRPPPGPAHRCQTTASAAVPRCIPVAPCSRCPWHRPLILTPHDT